MENIFETQIKEAKYFDPMEKIFEMCRQLDAQPSIFQNINIRGNMITVYMPIDEMLAYVNLLVQRGYADNHIENIWVHNGYARGGNYFKVGPYHLRLAQYREKMHNQQDVKYLMEKHQDEVALLNLRLKSFENLVLKIKTLLTGGNLP